MTETTALRQPPQEPLSGRVARRLRGCLAENRISQTDLARVMHMPQQKISRKVNGQTPFTLDELELLATVLEVELDHLIGAGEYADRPIGWVSLEGTGVDERPAAPGGGQAFLPLGEGFGAPSGTRTPNPLIRSQPLRGVVVPFKAASPRRDTRQGRPDTLRPTARTRHLRLVDEQAS